MARSARNPPSWIDQTVKRLEAALAETADAVNQMLDRLLPPVTSAERRVVDAMRYAVMGGGKRIRPFLVRHSARLFDVADAGALRVAAAIEMLHCYSLVHDDLPAMDDADLRRGRPSVHRQFDEATAILAGDGLLTHVVRGAGPSGDPCQSAGARRNWCWRSRRPPAPPAWWAAR